MHYAKASADDLLMAIQVTNAGPETATLHVLPTAWFRNTWSWDVDAPKPADAGGRRRGGGHRSPARSARWSCWPVPGRTATQPTALFCENETNDQRLFGSAPLTPYPKDGINDHVVSGAATVNPERTGTKCAFWYQLTVEPGETAEAAAAAAAAREGAAGNGGRPARRRVRPGRSRSGGPRPTSSTPS